MMQVPAIVVEEKGQITRIGDEHTCVHTNNITSECNTFSWGIAQMHVSSGAALVVCNRRTKFV